MRKPFDPLVCALPAAFASIAAPALAIAAPGGDGGEQKSIFEGDPWPYIFNLLMFLILFAVLAKFVWPRILEGLQAREEKQKQDLSQAELAAAEAKKALEENKQQLAEARQQAQKIVDDSRVEAEKLAARLRKQAEDDAEQMKSRARQEIQSAQEEALSEIYSQAAALSTQIAGKILRREITADDQQQLVDESLRELTRVGHN